MEVQKSSDIMGENEMEEQLMYEIILLDADGTLFDYDYAESYAFTKTIENLTDLRFSEELLKEYQEINGSLWKDLEKGQITSEALRTERFRMLLENKSQDVDVEKISHYYLDKLSEGSFLIEGAEEICQYLSEKYRLVIVTNGIKEVQKSRLEKSKINPFIEFMTISGEAGYSKPNPQIFSYTLNKINYDNANKCMMIGDSLSSDIQGGINFGIDTCWVNLKKVKNDSKLTPTYEINHLLGLKSIL